MTPGESGDDLSIGRRNGQSARNMNNGMEVDGTVESEWTTCITPTAFPWVSAGSGVFLNKLATPPARFFLQFFLYTTL